MADESGEVRPDEGAHGTTVWHIQVFQTRKTVTRVFGGRRRVPSGFGWSASGDPEGYEYHAGPFKNRDAAVTSARAAIAELGGTVSKVTDSGVPIDVGG